MRVGLTGGIGCGKSTAARRFANRGWQIIDCDAIVHELLADDPDTIAAVRQRFGNAVVDEDGRVDRPALGQVVFDQAEELAALEAILHPRVRQHWETTAAGPGDWLIEVPLLFEKNLQNRVDIAVCVFCHPDLQIERLEGRGVSRSQALARIKRQMALSEKAERADYVLLNDGTLAFLDEQVDHLLLHL